MGSARPGRPTTAPGCGEVFAGECLSQWDGCWDKVLVISDLATSVPPLTCADRPMSHRDTMGTSRTYAGLCQRPVCRRNSCRARSATVQSQKQAAAGASPPCLLSAFWSLSHVCRTLASNPERHAPFVHDASSRKQPPTWSDQTHLRGNRAKRGRQPVVAFLGHGTIARASAARGRPQPRGGRA